MNEYAIQSAYLRKGIDVGQLNKARTAFLDKHDATDMALFAVAQYVLYHFDGGMDTTFPKAGLRLEVRVTKEASDA